MKSEKDSTWTEGGREPACWREKIQGANWEGGTSKMMMKVQNETKRKKKGRKIERKKEAHYFVC